MLSSTSSIARIQKMTSSLFSSVKMHLWLRSSPETGSDSEQLFGHPRAGGGTALDEAIVQGLEHLQSSKYKKKALLLVIDGNDMTSLMDIREAVGTAHRSRRAR